MDDPGSLAARAAKFEDLIAPILGVAYGLALRLVRNQADAQDLVQEASLQAFRGFSGFQAGTNFKAWYLRILTNCFYMRHRKKMREPQTVAIDDVEPLYLFMRTAHAGLHDRSPDPAELLMSRLDTEKIERAMAALPEEYRVVTTLYFMDDLSYEEIAEVVGRPVGTVRSRLHRGRRMLQKALWQIAEEQNVVSSLTGKKE